MTDDTLRQQCEAFLTGLLHHLTIDGGYFIDPDKALDDTTAFARTQQAIGEARGLRRAADEFRTHHRYWHEGEWIACAEWCEQEAGKVGGAL